MSQLRDRNTIQLSEGGAPSRVPLNPYGRFLGNGVQMIFDDISLEHVNTQLRTSGSPWPLDWHHATVRVEDGAAERAPAAGYISGIEVEDGWVYGTVEWTPAGAHAVEAGEYAYISPVLFYDESGRVLQYHSFALTNRPGINYQRRIGLEEESMNKELLAMLGLAEGASHEQIRATLVELQKCSNVGQLTMSALGLTTTELSTADRARIMRLGELERLSAENNNLRAELQSARAQAVAERIDSVLRWAQDTGRIAPRDDIRIGYWRAQLERDLDAARIALEGISPMVPPAVLPTPSNDGANRGVLEADRAVAAMLGVSAEQLAKYGGE